ncbi:hypothetical protein AVEN_19089-1 [Araneus ventricosus]|uniref:Uncharacterized protein n=1 Tax=Araneus ventricosus TaxID=182803 RepID=A0A4Y2VIQ0_ARAVE|nr:hypothetical protein AVEN_19089-1 [Araneus ventricosus]
MLQLKHPSNALIVGPSQSGKTSLVRKIIKNKIYDKEIINIKWCYNYSSPWFLEEPDIEFVQGLPDSYENCDLIVIDDLMHQLDQKVSELFTVVSHHQNVSVILLLQNLFPKCKAMRDISLNSHYIILFKNARDMSQINCFARQLYPRNSHFMVDAYIKATASPYEYLVVDLHPTTSEEHRLRDSLFPDHSGIYWIYRPK